jgi:hypothetical protein
MSGPDVIFISIASYRDPLLVPTIKDALAKAAHPDDLRFGICWQHGPEEGPPPFTGDSRFRILDVPYPQSRGICWARAEIMKLFDSEAWFLQLDAHHRFVQDWDVKLIVQAARTGSPKPLLTAYAPHFQPDDPSSYRRPPVRRTGSAELSRIHPRRQRDPLFQTGRSPTGRSVPSPVRGPFVSGHMLFAPGSVAANVPYDPHLNYSGEEITLAVRAFTSGYDIFHPTEMILWHEGANHPIAKLSGFRHDQLTVCGRRPRRHEDRPGTICGPQVRTPADPGSGCRRRCPMS